MAHLIMHPDAESDLERLWRLDRCAAVRIISLLEEIEGDEDLLDQLSVDHFLREAPRQFDVVQWIELWKSGRNVFRLKAWDANIVQLPYRVLYAFIPQPDEYHILGVIHRDWDYQIDHPFSQRIIKAYDEL